MSMVFHLGRNVKEYEEKHEEIINQYLSKGEILCEICLKATAKHSTYKRTIKETGEQIEISVVWCRKCKIWDALLPDFLLHNKHYSGNEIESVIIDSANASVKQIDTEASESTVRRWIKEIGERITQAVSILKYLFRRAGQSLSEASITAGDVYSELEQVLEKAPSAIKYCGNKLGLANLWLRTNSIRKYI